MRKRPEPVEDIVLTAAELERMARDVGEPENGGFRGESQRSRGLDGGKEGPADPERGRQVRSGPSDLPKQAPLVTWCGECGAHFEVDFLLRCPVCGWRIPR